MKALCIEDCRPSSKTVAINYLLHLPLKYVFQLEENLSRAVGQNSLTPYGNNNMNFRLTVIRSCSLKPQQFYEPAGVKQIISSQFFSSFGLRGITKHFMTGPKGNSEFCFPSTSVREGSRGNKTHCFPWGQSLSAHWSLMKFLSSLVIVEVRSLWLAHAC